MQFELKINDQNEIGPALGLANLVFDPSPEEIAKYHQPQIWKDMINNGGVLITAHANTSIIGFAICQKKDDTTLHIWNVGVHPLYRGKGVWRKMIQCIEKIAVERNYHRITLNTYRDRFPYMYAFAEKNGFIEYHSEMHNGVIKSFFEKKI